MIWGKHPDTQLFHQRTGVFACSGVREGTDDDLVGLPQTPDLVIDRDAVAPVRRKRNTLTKIEEFHGYCKKRSGSFCKILENELVK
jgi:hypothetical protein